jgi:RHS repeat-associated protein
MLHRKIRSTTRLFIKLAICLAISFICGNYVTGQAQSNAPNRGFQPAGSYALTDLEDINTVNGNLIFRIPMASLPHGRGGSPGSKAGLFYNGKLYDTQTAFRAGPPLIGGVFATSELKKSEEGGWRYGFEYKLNREVRTDSYPDGVGNPVCPDSQAYQIFKLKMSFPDGSTREFRPAGYNDFALDGFFEISPDGVVVSCAPPYNTWTYGPVTYYSTDGTYLRLVVEHDDETSGWQNNPWTLYFPDGMRVTFNEPGASGQRIYDRNNNFTEIRSIVSNGYPAHQVIDQLNRSIIVEYDSAASKDYVRSAGVNNTQLLWTVWWATTYVVKGYYSYPTLFYNELSVGHRVVQKIDLPSQAGALSYNFGYNGSSVPVYPAHTFGYGELSSVTLPAPTTESPAQATYQYSCNGLDNAESSVIMTNYPTSRTLSYQRQYDGTSTQATEVWQYLSADSGYCAGISCAKVTTPDGSVSIDYITNAGNWDKKLVYKTERPDGTIVERIWQQNVPYGMPVPTANTGVNTLVKTEFTSVRNAGGTPVKTAIKDFNYDKNGNLTQTVEYDWVAYSSVPRSGDIYNKPTGIPSGLTPKRVTVNTYYNPTPDASNTTTDDPDVYHKTTSSRLRNAIESSEIRSGVSSGSVLSRNEYFYDNASTTGNLITERSWDSTKGGISYPLAGCVFPATCNSITVSHEYDAYGNRLRTYDGKNIRTEYYYRAVNLTRDVFLTDEITAFGTSVQRTTTYDYDFWTGVKTKTIDVDNNITTTTAYDVFGRPTLVKEAEGTAVERRAATEYSDTARRVITRADLNAAGDGKLVSIQHYDQLGRVRLSRTLEDSAAQDPYNEEHGIKVQTRYFAGDTNNPNSYELVSSPFRATTSSGAGSEAEMAWKRTKFERGGRVLELETFAGPTLPAPWGGNATSTGKVATSYDAEFTTVADQTNKSRRSVVDGLGRLVRVDEPDKNTGNLGATTAPVQPTDYTYNALGNLTQVNQGGQTRTYAYSSLGRLISATNPENGTFTYAYDNNANLTGKTDARSITATYAYDSLNRNTSISYSGGSTPTVERYYDGATKGKGRLWKSLSYNYHPTSGQPVFSYSVIDSYDEMGRPLTGSQQLLTNNGTQWMVYPVSRTYDRAGNVKVQTYPSSRTTTSNYDNAGRLSSFTGNIGDGVLRTYADSFLYNAFGQIKKERFGTNTALYHNIHYNSRGQAVDIRLSTGAGEWDWNRGALITYFSNQARSAGNAFLNASDNNGNVTMQEHYVPTDDAISSYAIPLRDTYEYDYLNRITQANGLQRTTSGSWISVYGQGYICDRWGNRTINSATTWGNAINNAVFTVDPANNNRLLGLGYDLAGNVTSDPNGGGTLTYDAENRMTSAFKSGVWSYYVYDADGRRVRRITGGVETWHVYGFGGELIAEYPLNGGAGLPSKEYGYRSGQLLIVGDASNVRWTVTDALGTPRIVAGKSGSLSDVTRHDYLPFGEELFVNMGTGSIRTTGMGYSTGNTPDGIRKKFTGYERDDETGLDFAQARYYSSRQGRFMSPDEFTGGPDELFDFADIASENPTFYAELEDPQSLNKYQYCYNDPLSYTDPDGHKGLREWAKQAVAVAADFADGAIRGAAASLSYGTAPGSGPSTNDSLVNRAGQVVGTAIVGAVGNRVAGAGIGITVGTGGVGALVGVPVAVAGGAMTAGAIKNAGAIITTPIQMSSSSKQGGGAAAPAEPKPGSAGGPGAGKPFSQTTKDAARKESNNTCVFCGVKTIKWAPAKGPLNPNVSRIDHAIPKSRGGNNTIKNAQNTCARCNYDKGNLTTEEYLKKRQQP